VPRSDATSARECQRLLPSKDIRPSRALVNERIPASEESWKPESRAVDMRPRDVSSQRPDRPWLSEEWSAGPGIAKPSQREVRQTSPFGDRLRQASPARLTGHQSSPISRHEPWEERDGASVGTCSVSSPSPISGGQLLQPLSRHDLREERDGAGAGIFSASSPSPISGGQLLQPLSRHDPREERDGPGAGTCSVSSSNPISGGQLLQPLSRRESCEERDGASTGILSASSPNPISGSQLLSPLSRHEVWEQRTGSSTGPCRASSSNTKASNATPLLPSKNLLNGGSDSPTGDSPRLSRARAPEDVSFTAAGILTQDGRRSPDCVGTPHGEREHEALKILRQVELEVRTLKQWYTEAIEAMRTPPMQGIPQISIRWHGN